MDRRAIRRMPMPPGPGSRGAQGSASGTAATANSRAPEDDVTVSPGGTSIETQQVALS